LIRFEGKDIFTELHELAELPMVRFGTVAEITPTAVLLASQDGAYYTGQTLGPNGGDVML
jgi:3-oxoacyl-[acyl-carrier protein] reductase